MDTFFGEEKKAQDSTAREANRSLTAPEVIARLNGSRQYAYQVGRWVWVEFPTRPAQAVREELLGLGFRWNSTRKVWQHACGHFTKRAPYDPREKYGVSKIEPKEVSNV